MAMSRRDFEILNHTADVGIIARGTDMKEVFANAARGMFSIITRLDDIAESLHTDIGLTAPDEEGLLVAWLNELIYLFDTENIIFKRFVITELDSTHLKARAYGDRVDSTKHRLKIGIKAATYHMLKIEKNGGCQAQVLFDI